MKRAAKKRKNAWFDPLSWGRKTTYQRSAKKERGSSFRRHAGGATRRPVSAPPKTSERKTVRYRGANIVPIAGGEYTISIDRDSRFESVKDAKAVIRRFAKNPRKRSLRKQSPSRPRHHSGRNPQGRRGRRNPDDDLQAAARLSEKFHGRPARTVREVEEVEHGRDTLADLGRMISFTVWVDEDRPMELQFKGVRLAASPDGGQLYLVGNQRLDLKALKLDRYMPKDHITVGPVETIVYHTSKAFHNFEPIDYEHTFAEEGGEQPVLGYDVLSEKFYLTGGSYQVKPEGIVN